MPTALSNAPARNCRAWPARYSCDHRGSRDSTPDDSLVPAQGVPTGRRWARPMEERAAIERQGGSTGPASCGLRQEDDPSVGEPKARFLAPGRFLADGQVLPSDDPHHRAASSPFSDSPALSSSSRRRSDLRPRALRRACDTSRGSGSRSGRRRRGRRRGPRGRRLRSGGGGPAGRARRGDRGGRRPGDCGRSAGAPRRLAGSCRPDAGRRPPRGRAGPTSGARPGRPRGWGGRPRGTSTRGRAGGTGR